MSISESTSHIRHVAGAKCMKCGWLVKMATFGEFALGKSGYMAWKCNNKDCIGHTKGVLHITFSGHCPDPSGVEE